MAEPILLTLATKVEPAHAAVLVVDVQNDFIADGGCFDRLGNNLTLQQAMVPRLLDFLEEARKTGVLVVFIQAVYDDRFLSPAWRERRMRTGTSLPLCLEGSWGGDFYRVRPRPDEVVVRKHRYSAFIGTDLDLILRSKGIKTLIMTGVGSSGCVEATARDGFMMDYYIVFLEDCSASLSEDLHQGALERISRSYGVVGSSSQVVQAWQESG